MSTRTFLAMAQALLASTLYAGVNVWTSHGPEGGFVNGPAVIDPQDPGTLYAGGFPTSFKSTDAAAHWSSLAGARIVAVDPQDSSTLYGVSGAGLIKSTNGGATWNAANSGLPQGYIASLVVDPKNSRTLYASTGAGVFKSTDGAASWSAAGAGLPDHRLDGSPFSAVGSLVMDPHEPGTLYAVTVMSFGYGGGIFKSTDGAASWSESDSGLTGTVFFQTLAIDPKNPHTLYLSGHRSEPGYKGYSPIGGTAPTLFKSIDAGASWTIVNGDFAPVPLVIDPQNSGTLYAPGPSGNPQGYGVWKSVDGGATWSRVYSGLEPNWVTVASGEEQSSVYAGMGGFGILKSTDGGATWASVNSGLTATSITAVAVDPRGSVYAGVNGAGIFKSEDGASTWNWSGLYENNIVSVMPSPDPNTLYAAAYSLAFRSTDGGKNWLQLPVNGILAVDPQDPATIYGRGGLKSTDAGASWVRLAVPQGAWISAVGIDPRDSRTLYAGTVQDKTLRALKSADGGASWTSVSLGSSVGSSSGLLSADNFYIERLIVDRRNAGTVYALVACDDIGGDGCSSTSSSYRSTDGGATWAPWDLPEGTSYQTIDPQGTIYVISGSEIFRSADSAASWSVVTNSGLTSSITALAVDPQNLNHLYAGSVGGGVFEITLAEP